MLWIVKRQAEAEFSAKLNPKRPKKQVRTRKSVRIQTDQDLLAQEVEKEVEEEVEQEVEEEEVEEQVEDEIEEEEGDEKQTEEDEEQQTTVEVININCGNHKIRFLKN